MCGGAWRAYPLHGGSAAHPRAGESRLRDALAILIFLATVAGVVVRPRGISEAVFCAAGATLMLLAGVIGPHAAWRALTDQWDVLLFLAGLLVVSWAGEEAGVFRWVALTAAHASHGSGARLFFNTFAAGVVLTTFFSLDATALLLTAVLAPLTLDLGLPPAPYALACAFIANSASLTLPVSNPLNILVLGAGGVRLGPYLKHLLPASVAMIAITVAYLWLRFRRAVTVPFDTAKLPAASSAIEQPAFFRITAATLAALAAAYVLAAARGWPLSLPVAVAGVVLLLVALTVGHVRPRRLAATPWTILPFVAGLLIVVRGLGETGLTGELGRWLLTLAERGPGWGVLGSTGVSAAGANALNNLPMGAVMLSALKSVHIAQHPGLLYGTLLGSDIGPNLTVLGALSSMLWLLQLRRCGVNVTARDFFREGVLLTPLLLAAGVLAVTVVA